ncbi:MAG TPA: acetylxylan esterase [Edaphobacter sp.]|uniref:alpha/beta hydrolase family protein n=1 Tax=Edaphobacter sp. TaxID=1934404 RepID=UPI002BAC5E17|nr:acetylxylan esterase [Edaphobacter sp.]HUZ94788.1 acetylxylan esterase [Edaphobacter sp.]
MPNFAVIRTSLAAAFLVLSTVAVQAQSATTTPVVNAGRQQLTEYLDHIAAERTAARRTAVASITTRAQAEARQAMVRKKILALIGGLPERTPLHARVVGLTQAQGFRIEKVIYDSQPRFPVTALLYLPDVKPGAKAGKLPAIVVAPGHGPTGKASDFGFASTFARNGFAVLSYDPIGQGERLQYPDPAKPGASLATRPTGEHGEAGLQPTLVGDAVARYFAWDGMRAVDYLQSRPEIDANRIGAFGCSGGGAMTALLGALDQRIKAVGTACYITSFDTLLPAIGPQDAEQSTPNFIASGLDFPDWVELAAPRPYAIIATTEDMFPFAGAQKSEAESRRFYGLFNADVDLEFLTGPGHHGNLGPIQARIVSFFLKHLQPDADAAHPVLPPPRKPGASPFALPEGITKDDLQVTSTGQVATSFPDVETVHSLNLKRYRSLPKPKELRGEELRAAVREVTKAAALPAPHGSKPKPDLVTESDLTVADVKGDVSFRQVVLHSEPGIDLQGEIALPRSEGVHRAVLLLANAASMPAESAERHELAGKMEAMAEAGSVVFAVTPRPSPPGTEETKSPILGPFYLTELRAELTGKTIMGMRIDDTIRAVDYLASRPDTDSKRITAEASGHLGLVLLHAAVLDARLAHITVDDALSSYRSLIEAPMPRDAPQDLLPGVVRHYDLPELEGALGSRLTLTHPLSGTDDLSASLWSKTN